MSERRRIELARSDRSFVTVDALGAIELLALDDDQSRANLAENESSRAVLRFNGCEIPARSVSKREAIDLFGVTLDELHVLMDVGDVGRHMSWDLAQLAAAVADHLPAVQAHIKRQQRAGRAPEPGQGKGR